MSTAQATLFELAPDYWYRLRETEERLMHAVNAPNTDKAYAHAWKQFSAWCASVGSPPLPAAPQTVCDFVTWCLYERKRKWRLGSVRLTLTAINAKHLEAGLPSPRTAEVRMLVRNAARELRQPKRRKDAMTPALLRRVCAHLSDGSTISIRDRAMILAQFAAGWRCSEIAGLQLSDLRFTKKGYVLTLGASKTDQDGKKGRVAGVEYGDTEVTCPVRALKAWLAIRGRWPGPLFCQLNRHGQVREHGFIGDTITERLHRALEAIGVNPARYGSHSLRSGLVTVGILRGVPETVIMARTGHKSLDSMRDYFRLAGAFQVNPLAGVL
jgi:integrase